MKYLGLVLAFVLMTGCNQSVDIDCSGYSKEANTHYWNGRINDLSFLCFEFEQGDTLVLNSEGGRVLGASRIIDEIIHFNIHTAAKGYCASACVMTLSWGVTRKIIGPTLIGIHETSLGKKELGMYNPEVNRDWLSENMVPYEDIYYFQKEEAFYNGLITHID